MTVKVVPKIHISTMDFLTHKISVITQITHSSNKGCTKKNTMQFNNASNIRGKENSLITNSNMELIFHMLNYMALMFTVKL